MAKPFTVCVLGYDNHLELLARCLNSIFESNVETYVEEIRLGLNYASGALAAFAERRLYDPLYGGGRVHARLICNNCSHPKYPMMRELFYSTPITTRHIMWFDDDSFVRNPLERDFFAAVNDLVNDYTFIGEKWSQGLQGNQAKWIRAQSWYSGLPVDEPGYKVKFFTGGWWTGLADTVRYYNYPWPELIHNGGDVMLGELCRQQHLKVDFDNADLRRTVGELVAINADSAGMPSKAVPRGMSANRQPIGVDYKPGGF